MRERNVQGRGSVRFHLRCIRFTEIRFVDASKTLLLQLIDITRDTARWRHNRRYRISSYEELKNVAATRIAIIASTVCICAQKLFKRGRQNRSNVLKLNKSFVRIRVRYQVCVHQQCIKYEWTEICFIYFLFFEGVPNRSCAY